MWNKIFCIFCISSCSGVGSWECWNQYDCVCMRGKPCSLLFTPAFTPAGRWSRCLTNLNPYSNSPIITPVFIAFHALTIKRVYIRTSWSVDMFSSKWHSVFRDPHRYPQPKWICWRFISPAALMNMSVTRKCFYMLSETVQWFILLWMASSGPVHVMRLPIYYKLHS